MDSLTMDYPFQIACVQPPSSLRKKSEKWCLRGRGRLYTGYSQADNPYLALIWKRPRTKFPCPAFLMIARTVQNDCLPLPCPWASLFRAANAFRVTWSKRVIFSAQIRHRNALTEIAWEDAEQGLGILGIAMSTVASEKNRELLFIGNVFYKQWHLWVLFHQHFEGTTVLKIANCIPKQEVICSLWKKLVPRESGGNGV